MSMSKEIDATVVSFPVRRLQVWYYTRSGQNYDRNMALAQFFNKHDLKDWIAKPVEPTDSEKNSPDEFVPLEVDLLYRQPPPTSSSGPSTGSADPIGSLKTMFYGSLISSITMFFNGRGEAHHVLLWPVGDNLPEKTRQCHTWVIILKSLAVKCHTTIDLAVAPKCDVPAEICRHATSLLCSAAVGADIALLIPQLAVKWRNGASMTEEYHRLHETWLKAEGIVLPDGCEKPRVALSSKEEIAKAWATVEPCLDIFRSIIMDMKECVDILSEGRTISPQLLYETIIHVRNATILFSVYEKHMGTINRAILKMETQKGEKTRFRINVALVVIIVAVTAGWFTGGLSTLVFAATGGAAAGGSAANEISCCLDIYKHEELIRQFDSSISKVGKALGEANTALTAVYCSQVLRMPLDSEHITTRNRKAILHRLGLDVDHLNRREYSRQVVESRIERLCQTYKEFEDKSQEVKDAANVRTRRNYTGSRISTQQLMHAE